MRSILCVFLLIAFSFPAYAQQANVAIVPLDKAMFKWEWNGGASQLLEGFKMKCGTQTKNYNITVNVPASERSVPVRNVIQNPGKYYCAVSAYNRYGGSGDSNEVALDTGYVPSSPTSCIIVVQ
jgi:hypothetical protein